METGRSGPCVFSLSLKTGPASKERRLLPHPRIADGRPHGLWPPLPGRRDNDRTKQQARNRHALPSARSALTSPVAACTVKASFRPVEAPPSAMGMRVRVCCARCEERRGREKMCDNLAHPLRRRGRKKHCHARLYTYTHRTHTRSQWPALSARM